MSDINTAGAASLRPVRGMARAAILAAALAATAPAAALLPQSWNGWHWARTGPLMIGLGDNLGAEWQPYLTTAASDWSAAKNIDYRIVAGASDPGTCAAVYGGIQVCSGNYGATGWLGYTNAWTSNGQIVEATVKINDFYFASAHYNTAAWRQMTICHELGHALGLAHADNSRGNANIGSCLDLTNDPSGKLGGVNGTLDNMNPGANDFAALNGIYAKLDASQLPTTKPSYFLGHADALDGSGLYVMFGEGLAVPEPATWALLIAGFGLTGTAMRRRLAAA